MRVFVKTALVLALLTLGLASPAQAKLGLDVGGELLLGMGGSVQWDGQGFSGGNDLAVTAGFGLFADYEVFKYIDVGGQLNLSGWKSDTAGADRNLFVDIAPFVKGKYRLFHDALEVYGKVPFGMTINHYGTTPAGDKSTDLGFHTGILAGVSYNVWAGLWPFLELGWTFHWVNHTMAIGDVAGKTNQFALNIGASWAF